MSVWILRVGDAFPVWQYRPLSMNDKINRIIWKGFAWQFSSALASVRVGSERAWAPLGLLVVARVTKWPEYRLQ